MFDLLIVVYRKFDRHVEQILNRLRLFRLKCRGAKLGSNVRVYGRFTLVGDARKLSIGACSTINEGVFLNLRAPIFIGDNVHLSPYAQLHTGSLDPKTGWQKHKAHPIQIGSGVWIASGAIVTGGVQLGEGSVVAANAVVINDVPPNKLVGGVPARMLRA